jgi:predicted peptidase
VSDPINAAELVRDAPLPYLLAAPAAAQGPKPVLCFLHGYDEGPPTDAREGLTKHGPLRPDGAPAAVHDFIVVAPQLPARGDLWSLSARAVMEIVRGVHQRHGGDPARTYLTGFSFGGNGVFDLAAAHRGFWAALWAVDPTRVPAQDTGAPLWLSFGEVARFQKAGFVRRLAMREEDAAGDRVYTDHGEDHVGSATSAYRDERIYRWLLARRLP